MTPQKVEGQVESCVGVYICVCVYVYIYKYIYPDP